MCRRQRFIIDIANSGLITMNALPLAFSYEEKDRASIGSLMLQLNGPTIIPQEALNIVKKVVSNMNIVLSQIVPGLTIDELDSGVFEYLLGELLRIISEKGKGQLIFTSHNLRPLETIDRGFIAFTTTNVDNRYIRLSNVKTNNNLRDFYYRDIVLGEQREAVYDPTNNYEIALAFREAGELNGT